VLIRGLAVLSAWLPSKVKKGETIAGSADLKASSQAMITAAAAFMASQLNTFSTIREH